MVKIDIEIPEPLYNLMVEIAGGEEEGVPILSSALIMLALYRIEKENLSEELIQAIKKTND